MKRLLTSVALFAFVASCAHGPSATPATPATPAAAHRPKAFQSQQIVAQSLAVYDRNGQIVPVASDQLGIQNIGGVLKQVNADGTTSAIGGGGGVTSISAGTNIASIGGTASVPIINASTQADPGTVFTAGGAVTDLDATGLTGDADGDYWVDGRIILTGAGSRSYVLQPNGISGTGQFGVTTTAGVGVNAATDTVITPSINSAAVTDVVFKGTVKSKSGGWRYIEIASVTINGATAGVQMINSLGVWETTATVLTSLRVHCSVASQIGTGSYIRVGKLGRTN